MKYINSLRLSFNLPAKKCCLSKQWSRNLMLLKMNYLKIIFFISAFLFIPLTANGYEENPLTLDKSTIRNLQISSFTKCSNDEVRIKAVNNSFAD